MQFTSRLWFAILMVVLPAHAGEMRVAGQAFATVDARGHVKAWAEGCAAYAADGDALAELVCTRDSDRPGDALLKDQGRVTLAHGARDSKLKSRRRGLPL